MKVLFRLLLGVTLTTAATSCESFLDINENPNTATSVNPDAILANALVTTASNYVNFNTYSSFAAGYWGKSGTVSGFAEEQSYNYSSNYQQGLFNTTYDNLNDYNIIQTEGVARGYTNHAAIARIMKVYNYQLLVDQYGDIPYTQALQGLGNIGPKYDKAEDIYKDFVVQLKGAVADINAAKAEGRPVGAEDVVFGGGTTGMTRWKQFANSLRLRVLLRQAEVPALQAYIKTEMTALQAEPDGFIDRDVQVQPGYAGNSNQQNPFYNIYGFPVGSTRATSTYSFIVPTNYIIEQYERNNDPRITQLYRVGQRNKPGTTEFTPGYVGTNLGEAQPPQFNPAGGATVGSRFLQGGTFLRGANQPTVLMLLAEHLFAKSEAEVRSLMTGDAKADYLNGIKASFMHTYRAATAAPTTVTATSATAGVTQYEKYIADNATNGLVSWEAPTTFVREGTEQEAVTYSTANTLTPSTLRPITNPRTVSMTEKILYQKYLANNTVASTEGWADFRRTGQPKFKISMRSGVTRLPNRLFYPQTEASTNGTNVPQGVTQFTKIFWDVLD